METYASCDIGLKAAFRENVMETTLIARFMRLPWGPSGADRTQVGPILAPWTLLSGESTEGHEMLLNPYNLCLDGHRI